jgi:hypothetical protein
MADAIALDAEAEALYGPRFQGAEHNGDYTYLVPVATFWRDLDRDSGTLPEMVIDPCATCPVRDVRGFPAMGAEQGRLFDAVG